MTAEATPAAACADADIALLAVRDHAQAETALFGPDGVVSTLRPGSPVILTSTVGPDAARDLADKLEAAGYPLVDAPISGGPVRAGNGDLLIVVGATADALAAAQPVLDALSSTLTVVGPRAGDGQALKAINQLLAGVHIAAAAEAIALARGLGLDPAVVIEALSQGAAGSFMFADRGPRMLQAYTGGAEVKSRIDIFVKDMGIVTAVGRTSHVPLPLAAAAQQLYLIAEAAGLGAAGRLERRHHSVPEEGVGRRRWTRPPRVVWVDEWEGAAKPRSFRVDACANDVDRSPAVRLPEHS